MNEIENMSNSEIKRRMVEMENEYNILQIKINNEIDKLREMNETYIFMRKTLENRGVQ